MKGNQHIIVNCAIASIGMVALHKYNADAISPQLSIVAPLAGIMLGSILPDIDIENSKASQIFGTSMAVSLRKRAFENYYGKKYEDDKYKNIETYIEKDSQQATILAHENPNTSTKVIDVDFTNIAHRTYTHGIYGILTIGIISLIIAGLTPFAGMGSSLIMTRLAVGLFTGYILHLVEDYWTSNSIDWLYPFRNKDSFVLKAVYNEQNEPVIIHMFRPKRVPTKNPNYWYAHPSGKYYDANSDNTYLFVFICFIIAAVINFIYFKQFYF